MWRLTIQLVEPCFTDTHLIQTHVIMDSIHDPTPYVLNKDTD